MWSSAVGVAERIPHSRPTVGPREAEAAHRVIESGQLAAGGEVRAFEDEVARAVGVRGGVATSSGTAALHLLLLALGLGPGDEVVVPSYVCSAVLYAVLHTGARPVVVDVRPDDLTIDPEGVRRARTPRTRAAVVPHAFGAAADLEDLLRCGVPVVEDVAQALGGSYRGRPVGSFGVASVCSFYATKLITSGGEGGMVLSDDPALLRRVRELSTPDARSGEPHFNYKMTDLGAAVGRVQLGRLPEFLAARRELAACYEAELRDLGLELPRALPPGDHVYFRYVVRHPRAGALLRALRARGIEAKRPVKRPLHWILGGGECTVADAAHRFSVSLPLYPSLRREQARQIAAVVRSALGGARGG